MLISHGVFSEAELKSRCEIMLENYCKTVIIEANTMVDMARTEIAPAIEAYILELAKTAAAKKSLDLRPSCIYENGLVNKLSTLVECIATKTDELEKALVEIKSIGDIMEMANAIRDKLLVKMSELRLPCDEAETLTAKKYWPFPTYGDLLFSVN